MLRIRIFALPSNYEIQHIAVSYDFSLQTVYVNGKEKAQEKTPQGHFSNWSPSCRLVLGNEVYGSRPWKGKIYYVAIYNRALRFEEIQHNYSEAIKNLYQDQGGKSVQKSLIAQYNFETSKDRKILNHDTTSELLNLYLPENITTYKRSYLDTGVDFHQQRSDIFLNILGFVPFGFMMYGFAMRFKSSFTMLISVLIIGIFCSFSFESIQYFSLTRSSSAVDLLCNTSGLMLGIMMYKGYYRRLTHFFAQNNP